MKNVDDYLEAETYYCIDFIPYDASEERFLEYEEYFEKKNINQFSSSIVNITLKSIYWIKCRIYLEKDKYDNKVLAKYPVDVDLNNIVQPIDIEHIVTELVKKDTGSLNIIFDELDSMLCIKGGLCVCFYSEQDDYIAMMKQLVNSEGLFVRHLVND